MHVVADVGVDLELVPSCVAVVNLQLARPSSADSRARTDQGDGRTLHLPDEKLLVEPVRAGEEEELGCSATEELAAQAREPSCARSGPRTSAFAPKDEEEGRGEEGACAPRQ